MRVIKTDYEELSVSEIEKQIKRLTARLDNLYTDKLDGRIDEDYWREKHNHWYNEKEELIKKLHRMNETARTFDEGSNLLEKFCKHVREEYLRANLKTKRQILKLIGSNFSYKDGKLSVELTSVFDLLIKSASVLNGVRNRTKLELAQFVKKLKNNLEYDYICKLKCINFVTQNHSDNTIIKYA